jgi:TrmH family RNA methyltransferase
MKNFGLKELVLVNPKCTIDDDARARAKHAYEIIERARVVKDFKKAGEFDLIVGTTGKIKQGYDEVRCSITPKELAGKKIKGRIALVFGREGTGLSNEELSACDIVVHIPADGRYPIMNISHAAAVLFYELFSAGKETRAIASRREKEVLFDYFDAIVLGLENIREKKKVAKIFRNVVNRAAVAGKEAHALAGALNEIKKKLAR